MKTIGIVGCRIRNSSSAFRLVENAFESVYEPGDSIVSGGCSEGGDRFAELIAKLRGISITIHPPDKTKIRHDIPYKAAYRQIAYARNTLIANEADILIACYHPMREGGTEDTIRKFSRRFIDPSAYLILV